MKVFINLIFEKYVHKVVVMDVLYLEYIIEFIKVIARES